MTMWVSSLFESIQSQLNDTPRYVALANAIDTAIDGGDLVHRPTHTAAGDSWLQASRPPPRGLSAHLPGPGESPGGVGRGPRATSSRRPVCPGRTRSVPGTGLRSSRCRTSIRNTRTPVNTGRCAGRLRPKFRVILTNFS